MSKVEMTVRQIIDLGLWDRVCDYRGWNPWILNEGLINDDELVEFDSEFKKEYKEECDVSIELEKFIRENSGIWDINYSDVEEFLRYNKDDIIEILQRL